MYWTISNFNDFCAVCYFTDTIKEDLTIGYFAFLDLLVVYFQICYSELSIDDRC